MSRHTESEIRGWAKKAYKDHTMAENISRSFRFRRSNGDSAYAFTLTWTPGTVSLAGDVGEIALVHYSALRSFRSGMQWLAGSSYEYLMEKATPSEEVFDLEGTYDFILEWATREAVQDLQHVRSDRRRLRKDRAEALAEWQQAHSAWLALPDRDSAEEPQLDDFEPDTGYYDLELIIRKAETERFGIRRYGSDGEFEDIPDGFQGWFSLWRALRYEGYVEDNPNTIFKASGRREIKDALKARLEEGKLENAAKLCQEIGFEDYYGSTKYCGRSVWQIEALKHGAGMILEQLAAEDRKIPARIRALFRQVTGALSGLLSKQDGKRAVAR